MTRRPIVTTSLAAVLCAATLARAADPPPEFSELSPAARAAIDSGLAGLAKLQEPDGSFGKQYKRSVAISAISAMAFMQAGHLPGRGRYGAVVEKAVTFMLSATQESGLICADTFHPPMYGHGFATLFMAEVYGMTGDERVKEKLQKAVRLIERSQNNEGGWRYQPAPVDADISVTICEIMALRAARDAGIKVEKDVIDKAIGYVRRCQNGDGGFSYQARGGMSDSGFARTGAGIASLFYAGVSEGREIDRGLAFIRKYTPGKNARADAEGNYFYGHYYAVQAMYQSGGRDWAAWFPAIRDQLLQKQTKATGLWSGDGYGDEYSTGMALLIIQMPNRYLPVYSGKGPGS